MKILNKKGDKLIVSKKVDNTKIVNHLFVSETFTKLTINLKLLNYFQNNTFGLLIILI